MGKLAKQKAAERRLQKAIKANQKPPPTIWDQVNSILNGPRIPSPQPTSPTQPPQPPSWNGLTLPQLRDAISHSLPSMLYHRILNEYTPFLPPIPSLPPITPITTLDWAALLDTIHAEQKAQSEWKRHCWFLPQSEEPSRHVLAAVRCARMGFESEVVGGEEVAKEVERYVERKAGRRWRPEENSNLRLAEFVWNEMADRAMADLSLVEAVFKGGLRTLLLGVVEGFVEAYFEDVAKEERGKVVSYRITERGEMLEKTWDFTGREPEKVWVVGEEPPPDWFVDMFA